MVCTGAHDQVMPAFKHACSGLPTHFNTALQFTLLQVNAVLHICAKDRQKGDASKGLQVCT